MADNVFTKLMQIQQKLKAPKDKENDFGNYKYRSCEDILEAAKPLLAKTKTVLFLRDAIEDHGAEIYIKATATLTDTESGQSVETTAFARESKTRKKMDDPQMTGTASSYARKYALNGLFCIDDTKDPDSNEYRVERANRAAHEAVQAELDANLESKISTKDATVLENLLTPEQKTYVLNGYKIKALKDLTVKQSGDIKTWLKHMEEKAQEGKR